MHTAASQTFILNLTPQIPRFRQRVDQFIIPSHNCTHLCFSSNLGRLARINLKRHCIFLTFISIFREHIRCHPTGAVLPDSQISSDHFEDFSVSVAHINDDRELKISIEVSGNKTQKIFDDVFEKMVGAAQPIPGFRRVKGGKTPDIPKEILLEVLGPSKVHKEVIMKVINSTVGEYVNKESLTVSNDLRVEQSFEDLETSFEPGEKFSFDVVVQRQK